MHNVDMWNGEAGVVVKISKEKNGKKVSKGFSPKPASMRRLSIVVYRMQLEGKIYLMPFICEGCAGWSSRLKVGH